MARYDPFEEMDRMFEQMRTRMWNAGGPFGQFDGVRTGARTDDLALTEGEGLEHPKTQAVPATRDSALELRETDGEYVFVADLPGFEKEEIDLTFDGDTLVIAAEHEVSDTTEMTGESGETANAGFARSRRVSERVTVPDAVEDEEITASYRNGVLEVHLPLVEPDEDEADDGKQIRIED